MIDGVMQSTGNSVSEVQRGMSWELCDNMQAGTGGEGRGQTG